MEHQAADTLTRLRTGGKEKTILDDDRSLCNVKNTRVSDGEISYLRVDTNCEGGNESRTGRPEGRPIEERETRVCTVQLNKRQTRIGEVPSLEKLIVERMRGAYCRKVSTQVDLRGSEFYIDRSRLSVGAQNIDGCLQKVVPVSLGERFLHVEH